MWLLDFFRGKPGSRQRTPSPAINSPAEVSAAVPTMVPASRRSEPMASPAAIEHATMPRGDPGERPTLNAVHRPEVRHAVEIDLVPPSLYMLPGDSVRVNETVCVIGTHRFSVHNATETEQVILVERQLLEDSRIVYKDVEERRVPGQYEGKVEVGMFNPHSVARSYSQPREVTWVAVTRVLPMDIVQETVRRLRILDADDPGPEKRDLPSESVESLPASDPPSEPDLARSGGPTITTEGIGSTHGDVIADSGGISKAGSMPSSEESRPAILGASYPPDVSPLSRCLACDTRYDALLSVCPNCGASDAALPPGPQGLEVIARRESATACFNQAVKLRDEGQLEEAIAQTQTGLEVNPKDATGHSNLGALYLQAGLLDQAVESLVVALRLNPRHGSAPAHLRAAITAIVDELVEIGCGDEFTSAQPGGKFNQRGHHVRALELAHLLATIGEAGGLTAHGRILKSSELMAVCINDVQKRMRWSAGSTHLKLICDGIGGWYS
jgi:hypothetical protein